MHKKKNKEKSKVFTALTRISFEIENLYGEPTKSYKKRKRSKIEGTIKIGMNGLTLGELK